MATIVTIQCEECDGRSVVKIPNGYQDDYQIVACPLCGAPYDGEDQDLADEE